MLLFVSWLLIYFFNRPSERGNIYRDILERYLQFCNLTKLKFVYVILIILDTLDFKLIFFILILILIIRVFELFLVRPPFVTLAVVIVCILNYWVVSVLLDNWVIV